MERIYAILEGIRPENDFQNSKNYIEDALLDSLDILEVVAEIKERFGVEISPDDIIPENFVSVVAIDNLIKKYLV